MIISGVRRFILQYGANFFIVGGHARVSGLASSAPDFGLGNGTQSTVPFACVARQLTWESASATAATRMRLKINGVPRPDIPLTGPEGVVQINIAIPALALVALQINAGPMTAESTWILQCIGG